MKKLLCVCLSLFSILISQTALAVEKLEDVTGWNEIRWVITTGDTTGRAKMSRNDGETRVYATFSDLPTLQWWDFYEGWLVRISPFSIVSTGRLTNTEGEYSNYFSSNINYSSYTYYVLTLEPNDGNESAAFHILEGKIEVVGELEARESDVVVDASGSVVELSDYQKQLQIQLQTRLVNVSSLQRIALLAEVIAFQARLPSLDLEQTRKDRYAEILEVLVYVLS